MTACSTVPLAGVIRYNFIFFDSLISLTFISPPNSGDCDMVRAAIKNGANPNQSEANDVPVTRHNPKHSLLTLPVPLLTVKNHNARSMAGGHSMSQQTTKKKTSAGF